MKTRSICTLLIFFSLIAEGMDARQKTFCNPINIDYGYTPFKSYSAQGKHRATADPVIVNFKNKYFLFSTNQEGCWWSEELEICLTEKMNTTSPELAGLTHNISRLRLLTIMEFQKQAL